MIAEVNHMAIITISREFGSFGTTISQHAAQALDYAYIDKAVMEKVLDQYGLITFHRFYDSSHSFWDRLADGNKQIIDVFNKTALAFSRNNRAVFVGRAGFVLMRGYENVLNVLIRSPFEQRVTNVMETLQIADREEAAALVLQHDNARESYLNTFYKANSNDAASFHLVIDTSLIPPQTAEKWIVEAAKLVEQRKIDPQKSTESIVSDTVLQGTVDKVLYPD